MRQLWIYLGEEWDIFASSWSDLYRKFTTMKFENTQVFNFDGALYGMRNPKNSWAKSDSRYVIDRDTGEEHYLIGENDMTLAKALIRGGSEHRKFLRQIFVSVNITAPLYWWKEFDTYKVGTTANSTSTMHKLASTPITIDCFETDDYNRKLYYTAGGWGYIGLVLEEQIIPFLETLRLKYNETKDKRFWKELIRWLPESWLQMRTVTMNYENILSMCKQRRAHKLNEWSGLDDPTKENFISWASRLPYSREFIFFDEE